MSAGDLISRLEGVTGRGPRWRARVDKQRHGPFEGSINLWMRRDIFRFVGDMAGDARPYAKE